MKKGLRNLALGASLALLAALAFKGTPRLYNIMYDKYRKPEIIETRQVSGILIKVPINIVKTRSKNPIIGLGTAMLILRFLTLIFSRKGCKKFLEKKLRKR